MKLLTSITTAVSITAALTASTLNSDAREFIRQHDLGTGLTWDYHVSTNKGSAWSPIAIGKGGSLFSLHAKGSGTDNRIYKLDETVTGNSFPHATLTIHSEDPHPGLRTRADKPFTVSAKLTSHKGNNHSITIQRSTIPYQPNIHAPAKGARPEPSGHWTISRNGTHNSTFFPEIPATTPLQTEGEETFTAYTRSADGRHWLPLKTVTVQVWPVANASIIGIVPDSTITDTDTLKTVRILCRDLYPDSTTYVQIYQGGERLGTRGTIMPQSIVRFDTSVPQNQTIPLGNWSSTLPDGKYTLEVLSITPFNKGAPERLAHLTFVIDRGMHSPSMVSNQL